MTTLTKQDRALLMRPDLEHPRRLFAVAYSRQHASVTAAALREYGDHGAQISGCVRDHFPSGVKESLRLAARAVTEYSDAAWDARPPRVRRATMRALARAMARRDGSGFYGPQP